MAEEMDAEEVDALVLEQIRRNFPDDPNEAINSLPDKKTRRKSYARHRQIGQQREEADERVVEVLDSNEDYGFLIEEATSY